MTSVERDSSQYIFQNTSPESTFIGQGPLLFHYVLIIFRRYTYYGKYKLSNWIFKHRNGYKSGDIFINLIVIIMIISYQYWYLILDY